MTRWTCSAIIFLSLSSLAWAAAPCDGVWDVRYLGSNAGYVTTHENGGVLVAGFLPATQDSWDGLIATITGNQVMLTTLVSRVDASVEVVFTSADQATATVIDCTPIAECDFPPGATMQLTRIF